MRVRCVAAVALAALATLGACLEPVGSNILDSRQMFTDSVAYCGKPHAILVSAFDVAYFRNNNSVSFSFSANAIPNNLSSTVDLHLYAFGLDVVEFSLDLCTIGNRILCPLPTYSFAGSGEYTLPADISSKVPGIIFTALDIEVVAILRIIDNARNTTAECLQVTLSNGRSTNVPVVAWVVVAVTGLLGVVALAHTVWPESMSATQWRIVDLVGTLQHIAYVSFAAMMLPKVFREFANLFLWATGVIFMAPIQHAILTLRLNTGAYDRDIIYRPQLDAQTVRDMNLYATHSLGAEAQKLKQNLTDMLHLRKRGYTQPLANLTSPRVLAQPPASDIARFAPNTGPGGEMSPGAQAGNIVSVSTDADFSQVGIKYMSERARISPYGLFLTVLINWLFFVCIVLAAVAVMYAVHAAWLASPAVPRRDRAALNLTPLAQARLFYRQAARPVLIRALELATEPLLIFILYQWAHAPSWAAHLIAAITFVALAAAWTAIVVPLVRHARRARDPHVLYLDAFHSPYDLRTSATKVGSLAHPWTPRCYWFGTLRPVLAFVRACFLALPQGSLAGLRQAAGLAVVEVLYLVLVCVLRPGRDRAGDAFAIVMTLTRIIAWAVAIALTPEAAVYGIPRAVLGYVLLVVTAVPYLIVLAVMVWDALAPLFRTKHRWHARDEERAAPSASATSTARSFPSIRSRERPL